MLSFVVSVNVLVTVLMRGSPVGPRMWRYSGHDCPTVSPNGGQVSTSLVPVPTTMIPVSDWKPGARRDHGVPAGGCAGRHDRGDARRDTSRDRIGQRGHAWIAVRDAHHLPLRERTVDLHGETPL